MESYIHARSAEIVLSGSDYFDRLAALVSGARKSIHLQTYIIADDATGREIRELLIDAARRGVNVWFLADAFGSGGLSKEFIRGMKDAGIRFRYFSPLFSSEGLFLGRRLHHKILVVDDEAALVGGINLADKYQGSGSEPAWLDLAVLIRGEACRWLASICEGIFFRKPMIEPDSFKDPLPAGIPIRFRRNDWMRGRNEISKSYREAIGQARGTVTILGSYFLPGRRIRKAIRLAEQRGAEVRVIVSGKTDVPFFHLAESYLYRKFLDMGAEIYEWPYSVMHGKAMVADDQWATIGSYNINYLSHYRSIEMNVDVRDRDFAMQISALLDEIITGFCRRVDPDKIRKKSTWWLRWKQRFAYYFLRFIMKLFLPRR